MVNSAALDARGLRKRYGKRVALDSVSLTVPSGAIHGLLGPNGSGKTTALHIVTGLLPADSGTVRVDGCDIGDKRSRGAFGFAPDDLPLPGALTGLEYLRFQDALRRRDDSPRATLLSEALGIDDELDKLVVEYSHGMQRKLQLISAVMHEPPLLVLDEPFRGLDPEAAATVRTLISTFSDRGGAVLIATHDMLRAERDCDHVTVLSRGRTVAEGSPAELRSSHPGCDTLEDVFMRVTGRDQELARKADWVGQAFTRDHLSKDSL